MKNILVFLAMLGPGIITGSVDNDAGGITTYSVAAATYGYPIIWTLLPSFIVLLVVQEMNMRMGACTGKRPGETLDPGEFWGKDNSLDIFRLAGRRHPAIPPQNSPGWRAAWISSASANIFP